jgi:hypothetical protein
MDTQTVPRTETWPSLPLNEWSETCATLHLWTQIVGKIRLVQSPWINHSWHVTLYVTARGLTTTLIPYGNRVFQIDFDFIAHRLIIQVSDGSTGGFPVCSSVLQAPDAGNEQAQASCEFARYPLRNPRPASV